jgi:hypothetical protein
MPKFSACDAAGLVALEAAAHPPLPAHGATRRDIVLPTTAARVDGALVFADTLVDWIGVGIEAVGRVLATSVQASNGATRGLFLPLHNSAQEGALFVR